MICVKRNLPKLEVIVAKKEEDLDVVEKQKKKNV